MFRVPSSDPPSTPDTRRASRGELPSTTPAGPPPTDYTSQSFTPAGPVPTSVFGSSFAGGASSNFSHALPAFGPSGHLNSPSLKAPLHTVPQSTFQPVNARGKGFAVPSSSPPQQSYEDDGDVSYSEDGEGDSMEEEEEDMDIDDSRAPRQQPQVIASREGYGMQSEAYSSVDSPRGLKRSRYGDVMANSLRSSRGAQFGKERDSAMPGIAKGLAARVRAKAAVEEPDDLVLITEAVLARGDTLTADTESDVAGQAASQLLGHWSAHVSKDSLSGRIGPKEQSGLAKANYIASLLVQLHHPSAGKTTSHAKAGSSGLSSRNAGRGNGFGGLNTQLASFEQQSRKRGMSLIKAEGTTGAHVPKALLDWLNTYHNPYPEDLTEVLHFKPSPTAHERFWDVIFTTMLRGNITTTVQLLSTADFTCADTALEDGYDEPGYRGKQLSAVQFVVARCVELLKTCPAVTNSDWDVRNTDWTLFRNRVRHALADLESFAEEDSADRDNLDISTNVFSTSKLDRSRSGMSFSTASRRAESKVPWTIYEQLRALYGQLQGLRSEILLSVQDWLEATIFLTVWWDGEDDEIPRGSLAASRRSLRQSQHSRQVDVAPLVAYRKQLMYAFSSVTDEPEDPQLGVNTLDPIQVGLGCICEDNVEAVIGLLRGWSMPIACAVTEIASAGRWLPEANTRSGGLMEGFDQDDLMVLNHGQDHHEKGGLQKDDVLTDYAALLAKKDHFRSEQLKLSREGWEMACRVLSRLDNSSNAQKKIQDLLAQLPLDSTQRVDTILAVCNDLGFAEQVRSISERYANSLADNTQSYGDALVYYARAHSAQHLKSTIDLLISTCLVQSAAYPPAASLDTQLSSLLNDQRNTLGQLAHTDGEAAQLLATYLSGYATLRRFYEYRDEGDEGDEGKRSGLRPKARKREGAKALLALIDSAADNIRGGLFDADAGAVLPVDTLLALLGEALPLMDHEKALLKAPQLMVLLRAIEDLQTVTSRVYEQADALFRSAMANYHGTPSPAAPKDLARTLSKSVSNLTGSSYGMITSQGSIVSADGADATSGDGAEDVKRGWDWRKGIAVMAGKNAQGADVLRVLRVQIAKEMAKAYAAGA